MYDCVELCGWHSDQMTFPNIFLLNLKVFIFDYHHTRYTYEIIVKHMFSLNKSNVDPIVEE